MNTTNLLGFCLLTSFLKIPPNAAIVRANITRAIVNTFFIVICITSNFAYLKAYHDTPTLRNVSNLLLANLALTDFLVGSIAQPLYVLRGLLEVHDFHNCILWDTEKLAIVFLCSISFGMLFLITVERAVATFSPFRYHIICSSNQVWRITVSIWITCLSSLVLLLYSSFAYYILIALFIFGISLLMMAMYCGMCQKAREQRRKITEPGKHNNSIQFHQDKKAEKTVSWVVGAVFLCYFPLFAHLVYMTLNGSSVYDLYVVSTYLTTLVFINSSLNPLIYCWRSRTIREAVKKVLIKNPAEPRPHSNQSSYKFIHRKSAVTTMEETTHRPPSLIDNSLSIIDIEVPQSSYIQ